MITPKVDEDEIVAAGQTIVYCLHQSIGYLGIFVSGKVATKNMANSPRRWIWSISGNGLRSNSPGIF